MSAFSAAPEKSAVLNGVRIAWREVGQNTRGRDGVPVVFLHGWPELSYSWRWQLEALEKAGVWAIAPDQRGYGASDRPETVEDYDIEHLTGDLVALLDHLGVDKGLFVGHDWGGIVLWQMGVRHKDRVAGLIGLNTPFMLRPPVDPIAIFRARMGEEMYIVHFQKKGEADAILDAKVRNVFSMFMRRPVPGGAVAAGFSSEKSGEESVFPLVRMVEAYDPAVDPRETFLTDDEMEVFVSTFERTGFTGGINWYRNFTRNWERSEGLPDRIDDVPSLMICAERDDVLPPSAAEHMPQFINDLEMTTVEGSGHWTQQEKPEAVNALILDWIGRRFKGRI
jgi:pimeloyl-ACP methyl ester carboxylesterase